MFHRNRCRRGNAFLIIIGILAIIFSMATFFIKGTVEEKHQTERSQRVVQTQCLAEAALERAMGVLARRLNDPREWGNPNSLSNRIRRPLPRSSTTSGAEAQGGLGANSLLNLGEAGEQPMVLRKEDLQGDNGRELDEMVAFMAGPGATYEVEVTVTLNRAFRIGPGPSVGGEDYKVPGVQIPWNCHPGVTDFLDNKGFVALTLALPENINWLGFSIPLEFAGIKVFEIDIIDVLQKFASLTNAQGMSEILNYVSIHRLLARLFPSIYPYKITFDKNIFPPVGPKFGSVNLPGDLDPDKFCEKFGYLEVQSKATITFPDRRAVTKTVVATKEFKCVDVEPVAPLYSFFIANFHDEILIFNDIGGNLFINNFAGLSAIKTAVPAGAEEKREFPGLVRVNGTARMPVNVGFIGNPFSPSLDAEDSFFHKLARSAEWLLMLDVGLSKTLASKELYTSFKAEWAQYTTGRTNVPEASMGSAAGGTVSNNTNLGGADAPPANAGPADPEAAQNPNRMVEILRGFAQRMNIVPPTSFGVTIFELPLHLMAEHIPYVNDPFGKWEWPWMGVGFRLFRLPVPTPSSTVTHLFGSAAMFPTMTREIEGFVLKQYRQWNLAVLSWPPAPIPVGKQIPIPWPPGLILPFPLPLWHTHDIANKYQYNLPPLQLPNADGTYDTTVHVYDPKILENGPPNLYSIEQYAKKATYYYPTAEDFYRDLPNRLVKENGKDCLKLNGITFIVDSVALPPPGSATLYVTGRGAIVTGGNVIIRGNLEDPYSDEEERRPETPRTVFSLIARAGGLIYDLRGPPYARIEGSVYTDKGIAVPQNKGLKIVGNWVTNAFSKSFASGDIMVVYTAYKTRSSLCSVHPRTGVYDPERYVVTLSPAWESWRTL